MDRRQMLAAAGGLVVGASIPAYLQAQEPEPDRNDVYVNPKHILYIGTGWKKGGGAVTQVVLRSLKPQGDPVVVKETMQEIVAKHSQNPGKFIGLTKDTTYKPGKPLFHGQMFDAENFTGGTFISGDALRAKV